MKKEVIFDPEPINELRILDAGNVAGLVNSLLDMFFSSAETTVAKLMAAARKNDCDELAALAHTMRATSGNLGAILFSNICGELEHMAMYEKKRVATDGVSLCRKLAEVLNPTLEILIKEKS